MGTTEFYLLPCWLDNRIYHLLAKGKKPRPITSNELDLAKAATTVGQPSSSGLLKWSEVHWDDSLTSIARPPQGNDGLNSGHVGCLVMSASARQRFAPDADHPDRYGVYEPYEFMSIVRWTQDDSPAVTRYQGFHAEVLGGGDVQIRQLDTGPRSPQLKKLTGFQWAMCDAANGYSKLDAASPKGTHGALFIEAGYARSSGLVGPKLPYWD